ncbi:hypothetical protein DYZ82_02082 [Listeria monocytogenes]|nr:hypothetical protein DYZ82_02082 [Listeria monocytogenes]
MNILFTLDVPEHLQTLQAEKFPEDTFYYESNDHFANLAEIDIIVTYGSNITEAKIKQASNLKFIMVFSAGVDSLPREIIQEKKLKLLMYAESTLCQWENTRYLSCYHT